LKTVVTPYIVILSRENYGEPKIRVALTFELGPHRLLKHDRRFGKHHQHAASTTFAETSDTVR